MSNLSTLLNLEEFEGAARERLPRMVFDYFVGGAAVRRSRHTPAMFLAAFCRLPSAV